MTSTISHGEIFLYPKGRAAERIRLRWEAQDSARGRPLPAGEYVVTGHRQVKSDDDGAEWIWSATSPGYRKLVVTAGEPVELPVVTTLGTRGRTFSINGKKRAGFSFFAEKRLGNTIYRNGARIAVRWNAVDAEGTTCAEGAMAYG